VRDTRKPTLAGDETGATLIEFGLFAPVLGLLAMGIIDLSQGLSERFTAQQAVYRGLELIQSRPAVTTASATDISYAYAANAAADAAGIPRTRVYLNQTTANAAPAGDKVILVRWRECNGVEATPFDGTCPRDSEGYAQDTARYIRIRVEKTFQGSYLLGATPVAAFGSLRIQ
jgi:Flp pilus assembly protein TadG